MDLAWYCREPVGELNFDPKAGSRYFQPWWLMLRCDEGLLKLYAWLLKRHGIPVDMNHVWGPHISVVKGEEPKNKEIWGQFSGIIRFHHTHLVRDDNGCHLWLDVFSEELSNIRVALGLEPKERYHLTIGRRDGGCNDGK